MQYIKNVSNKTGAYLGCEGIFKLHFRKTPDSNKIEVGATVVLCQKIENTRVFTHLVVVVDNNVYADESEGRSKYIFVQVVAKGRFNISDTQQWSKINSGGYSQGQLVSLDALKPIQISPALKPILQKEVWELFFPAPNINFRTYQRGDLK